MLHPSDTDLDRYRLKELGEAEVRLLRHHLICCSKCTRTLVEATRLTEFVRGVIGREAVAEYIENREQIDSSGPESRSS
jgi:hypothetical protein